MKRQPFFSVIMPIYNVEKYLPEAIESVLGQTFENFELILVNDKSPDNCALLCDRYTEKDNRVKVIHKAENQGLGMARNTGIENAKGEYLYFMDSDDLIEKKSFEIIKKHLDNDTDILVFGINRFFENKEGNITNNEKLSCEKMSSSNLKQNGEIFLKLTNSHIFPFAWNKVYRKEFILNNGAVFEPTKLIEDFLFNIDLFSKAQKIRVISDCLYKYRRPVHQTLANAYSPDFYELIKRKFKLESEFLRITDNENFEARQTILYSHIKHIISVFIRNKSKKSELSVKTQKEIIKNVLNEETTIKVFNEYIAQGIANKVICFVMKNRMINTCYVMIALINLLRKR